MSLQRLLYHELARPLGQEKGMDPSQISRGGSVRSSLAMVSLGYLRLHTSEDSNRRLCRQPNEI